VELLVSNMNVVAELLQGPCSGNQAFIAKDASYLHSLDKVLQVTFDKRISWLLRIQAKAKAMLVLASLLEARHDKFVHEKLIDVFDKQARGCCASLSKYCNDEGVEMNTYAARRQFLVCHAYRVFSRFSGGLNSIHFVTSSPPLTIVLYI